MIVLDASAALELLLWSQRGQRVAARLRGDPSLHIPELLAVEVAQVIRRLESSGEVSTPEGAELLDDLAALEAERYGHDLLLGRVFALRDNLTAYDATYVALAEALGASLLTYDTGIAGAPGHQARVEAP